MAKFLIAFVLFFYASFCGAVDLSKLDGAYPGFGCEQMVLYVFSAAKESRDVGYPLKDMLAWIENDRNTIKGKMLSYALGDAYFDGMADFLTTITRDIWAHPEISAEELRNMTRTNCEVFKGETDNFITFNTMHFMRQPIITSPTN